MYSAQYLMQKAEVYSDWFERKGDNLLFTADLVAQYQGELTVRVYHKDLDDTSNGTAAGSPIVLSSAMRGSSRALGLKELVRYKFVCVTTASSGQTDVDRVLFRMLSPVWFDKV